MEELYAGLDLGTSSAKLVVLGADGSTRARTEVGYPTHTAAGGIAEQHPDHWWQAGREAIAASGLAQQVTALGLTGQIQDLVLLCEGRPLRAAILSSDTHAQPQLDALHQALPDLPGRTGNEQDASSVAAKLGWLAEHDQRRLAAADLLLLGAPGHVLHRATGVACCDTVTASATGLLDVAARGWDEEVLAWLGVAPELLPSLAQEDQTGTLTSAAAAELGLRPGIAAVHAMGDAGSTTDGLVGSEPPPSCPRRHRNCGPAWWPIGRCTRQSNNYRAPLGSEPRH